MSTVYLRFAACAAAGAAARAPDPPRRAPRLEWLLARATASQLVVDWRLEALRVISPDATAVPAPAVIQLRGAATHDGAAVDALQWPWACMAAPVHYEAGMTSISLRAGGAQRLPVEDATALAQDFNREFGGEGVRLHTGADGWLVCLWDRTLTVTTHDPADAAGGSLFDHQPTGPDAARLRRLASAVEMWLFDHPMARARAAAQLPVINGLWFWGGGRTDDPLPEIRGWTAGDDPLFAALGRLSAVRTAGVDGFEGHGAGPAVVVCAAAPGGDGWHDAQRRWLEPAVAALRAGRLRRIDLSAGARRCALTAGFGLRFWRRPRPWWEYFDAAP